MLAFKVHGHPTVTAAGENDHGGAVAFSGRRQMDIHRRHCGITQCVHSRRNGYCWPNRQAGNCGKRSRCLTLGQAQRTEKIASGEGTKCQKAMNGTGLHGECGCVVNRDFQFGCWLATGMGLYLQYGNIGPSWLPSRKRGEYPAAGRARAERRRNQRIISRKGAEILDLAEGSPAL